MPIILPKKTINGKPSTPNEQPKGSSAKLAALIEDHADHEFEGFTWLRCHLDVLAAEIGVNESTIRRLIKKPPFRHVVRKDKSLGRYTLIRIGTEPCENDRVFILREIWAKGLVRYNAEAVDKWTNKVIYLKSIKAPKATYERLLDRIEKANDGAKDLDKLKAGEKISAQVAPSQMGQLRGVVQTLGEDAPAVLAHLVTFEGWRSFTAYLKADERLERYYHWPSLGTIRGNPDIALQTYLDAMQEAGKIDLPEASKLLAKIGQLAPQKAA